MANKNSKQKQAEVAKERSKVKVAKRGYKAKDH